MEKLSEAMRAGMAVTTEMKGAYLDVVDGEVCTCALGAAYVGLALSKGKTVDHAAWEWNMAPRHHFTPSLISVMIDHFVNGDKHAVVHPVTGNLHRLRFTIENLMDRYKWTREDVAVWLEGLGL